MIKKGIQIYMVIMNGKHVDVLDVDQTPLKVTRTQRNLLTDVKIQTTLRTFKKSLVIVRSYIIIIPL